MYFVLCKKDGKENFLHYTADGHLKRKGPVPRPA